MEFKFFNLDDELIYIQKNKKKYKKINNIIYLLDNDLENDYLTSKDFYCNNLKIKEESIILYENNTKKEDALNLLCDQLDVYYIIFNLPSFNIDLKTFENFFNSLYDYINSNNKGSFLEISSSLNRIVLADALIHNKEIRLYNYIKNLNYLKKFNLTDNDIKNIKEKYDTEKIVEFKIKKKI